MAVYIYLMGAKGEKMAIFRFHVLIVTVNYDICSYAGHIWVSGEIAEIMCGKISDINKECT